MDRVTGTDKAGNNGTPHVLPNWIVPILREPKNFFLLMVFLLVCALAFAMYLVFTGLVYWMKGVIFLSGRFNSYQERNRKPEGPKSGKGKLE
jgi:hypothetical protein